MKQEPEEPRPSHHHRRITEAAPPPTNNHSIHHKFIHDHCCSSVSSNCVFFCPPPKSYPLLGGGTAGERRDGAAALCPRRDTPPPGRRVGFFARVLSFFAVQKKCFPGFSFLPRDLFGHPSTLWRFPYMGAPWSRSTASPASPSVHRPAPNQVCTPTREKEYLIFKYSTAARALKRCPTDFFGFE